MSMDVNKIINGSFGRVWLNGELFANVISFESKVTGKFEDVDIAGELGTFQKYMGYEGAGTIKLHKIDSRMVKELADAFNTGVMPEFKIIARLTDPAITGEEAIELTGVTFSELMFNFEQKKKAEEEVPFKFAKFKYIDTI